MLVLRVSFKKIRIPGLISKVSASLLVFSVIGLLIIWGAKIAYVLLFFALCLLAYFVVVLKKDVETANRYLLYLTVFSIFLPYLIKFMGRDAVTLTTLMIFFLFFMLNLTSIYQQRPIVEEPKILFFLPIFIFFNFALSFFLNSSALESSVRYLIANISGIFLYFVITAIIRTDRYVVLIIKIVLFSLIIQSAVSFLQLKYPEIAKQITSAFGTRSWTHYAPVVKNVIRANGIIGDYELLAQMFLVGSILSLGLIFQTGKYIYSAPMFCCIAGIVFTKTRSSILILIVAIIMIYGVIQLVKRDNQKTSLKTLVMIISGAALIFLVVPQDVNQFIQRLETFFHSSRLISAEAIDRQEVWQAAMNIFLAKPSIFGKGLYDITSVYTGTQEFHSLYLTILYKLGIVGLALHALFWATLIGKSLRNLLKGLTNKNWHLTFFLICAVLAMLVDSIKIEYLRNPQTIQFAWLLYGLLGALIIQSRKDNENSLVP